MKKLIYFFLVIVLLMGCVAEQNKKEYNKLRDSLANMVLMGTLREDTIMLEKALDLSEFLLRVDTTNINKRFCYHQRSMVFISLGYINEAMTNGECAMMTLPVNNPQRLTFMSLKYLSEQKKDSANCYIERAITVCDNSLKKEFNEDMAINKIKAIFLRDGEIAAKACLSGLLVNHPNCPVLRSLDEGWDEWVWKNNEELKQLKIVRY